MEDADKKVQADELKEYNVVKSSGSSEENTKPSKGKKILKTAAWVFGVLIVVLVLAVIFRDVLIENSIRHIGTLVTGTEVKIESFKTSLSGTVELKKIKVANPAGYQKPYAFEVDRVFVKLLPQTLTSQEPVVETVEVSGVRIDMEMKGAARSNLTEIQANVEKFAGAPAAKDKAKNEKASDADAPAPLIKKIALTSMSISFSSAALKSSVPVPLAPIYLQNVGGKGKPLGKTIVEITNMIMRSINTVGGTVMSGVDAIGNAGKNIGEAGKKLGNSVGDLFKTKK